MKVMSSGEEGAMEEDSLEPGDIGVDTGLQSDIPYLWSMSRMYLASGLTGTDPPRPFPSLRSRSWVVGPRSLSLKWVESSLMKAWMAGWNLEIRVMSSTNTGMMILRVS